VRCAAHRGRCEGDVHLFTLHIGSLARGIVESIPQIMQFTRNIISKENKLKSTQEQVYNTGRRIQAFLDANDSLFSSINKAGLRSELDAVVTELGAAAGDQAGGRVNALGETAKQRALRLALRLNHMRPIASIAQLKLRTVPNFEALTMPDDRIRVAAQVAHAFGMADAAKPYEQVFIDAGLPTDFLASLTAAAMAVQASIDTRAKSLGKMAYATGSLTDLEGRARKVFKALNDVVVPIVSGAAAKSGLLAEWNTTRRVTKRLGPPVGAEQQARASSTPAVPSTPSVAGTPSAPTTPAVIPPVVTP